MDIDGPGRRLLDLFHPLHCAWQNELVHFADTGWQMVAKFCRSRDFLVAMENKPNITRTFIPESIKVHVT